MFLIGINDPDMPMIAKGDYTSYPRKPWLEEYQRRAEKLMLIMLREGAAAKHPDVVYVDTYDLLATKKGGFSASLRRGDGVHFTDEGAGRTAAAVWAAMKRDWLPAE